MNVIDTITQILSYPFMIRALIGGLLISVSAAILGVSLVLKRYSMIGDGLSHVGFGALAIGAALNLAPLTVAIPVVVLAAFLLLRITESSKIKADAAIALISAGALAIGIMVISMTTGMTVDVNNYMFGSILALKDSDVILCAILGIVVLAAYSYFYHRIFALTFDEEFSKTLGLKTGRYQMLIAALTAIVVVVGMKLMGALLMSSFIIFPVQIALKLSKQFKGVVMLSLIGSIVTFLSGMILSFILATPTGASIVFMDVILLIFVSFARFINKKRI